MSAPPRRLATWDDLLDVREGYVGEIVDGQLRVHPRPGAPHAETTSDLGGLLTPPFRFGRGGPGGWVIVDEPRVALLEDIRVPDLAGWRTERYARPEEGPYRVVLLGGLSTPGGRVPPGAHSAGQRDAAHCSVRRHRA